MMNVTAPHSVSQGIGFIGGMSNANPIHRLPSMHGVQQFALPPATVLIGNNGVGKTSLINALAAGAGLGARDMKLGDSSADRVQETIDVYGLLNPSVKFEAVFRFLGDRVVMRRGHTENVDDVLRAWNSHASHGEVSSGIMLNLVMIPARDAVKSGKSTLLLLDEPEGGQSPENLLEMCNTIQQFCQMALQSTAQGHPFYIIVATQSPFVLMAARRGGARDMDLGGWRVANPYPALIQTLTAV